METTSASRWRKSRSGSHMFDVIEHVEDDRGFVASLRPYLRERGRLYITTPAYPRLWSATDVRSGHFRRYTLALFFRTLRSADAGSTTRSRSQHRAGGAFLRHVAEACFAFEVGRIARGSTIPFGGSCLMVATPARA